MTLAQRTRAVAKAGEGREYDRLIVISIGLALVAGGQQWAINGATWFGLGLVGWVVGTLSVNTDRSYMEGFSDGLVAADELADQDAKRPARPARRPEPDRDLRGLSDSPLDDDDRPADDALSGARRAATGSVSLDPNGADIAGAFGVQPVPRQPGPSFAPDGVPAGVSSGPRRSSFPDIEPPPPPIGSRSPSGIPAASPSHRRQARRARSQAGKPTG